MTRLLVSVRNADEAREALAGGADLLDVKEPRHGALGAADARVWRQVRDVLGPDRPLSVALGELRSTRVEARARRALGVQFAKIGLAGCGGLAGWQARWRAALACLPASTTRVAVAYADYEAARAPTPDDVLHYGLELGCRALLVDTFTKSSGGLFDYWPVKDLAQFSVRCRAAGLLFVVGGSLSSATIATALRLQPDYIAVRGAACETDRNGRVDGTLVKGLFRRITAKNQSVLIPE